MIYELLKILPGHVSKLWQKLGCEARFQMKAQVSQEKQPWPFQQSSLKYFNIAKESVNHPLSCTVSKERSFLGNLFSKHSGVPTAPQAPFSAAGKHLQRKHKPPLLWSPHSSVSPRSALLIFMACVCVFIHQTRIPAAK